jgi:twinkle protein
VQVHVQKVRKKQNGRIGVVEFRYNKVVGQYSCQSNVYPKSARRVRELPNAKE